MQHKCFKCGTEFDGNFCPECGEKWEEGKTCPKCGKSLVRDVKFCPDCGHSFAPAPSPASRPTQEPTMKQPPDGTKKLYSFVSTFPKVLFGLLSAAFLLIFFAPVAVIPGGEFMGETIPNESYGNVYELPNFDGSQLSGSLTALIVSVSCAAALTILLMILSLFSKVRYKRILFMGKSVLLSSFFTAIGYGVFFILFLVSCIALGQIAGMDGGFGIITAGAAPILTLVFSLIGCLAALVCAIAGGYLRKAYPALVVLEEQKEKSSRISSFEYWVSDHKIKATILFILLVGVITASISIPVAINNFHNGIYYAYNAAEETYDTARYYKLSGSTWTDEGGRRGKFSLNGNTVAFSFDLSGGTDTSGSSDMKFEGTLQEDVLKIGGAAYVKKGHEHVFSNEWKPKSKGSCIERGTEKQECICGKENIREWTFGDHDWQDFFEEADCARCGGTGKRCSLCGFENATYSDQALHVRYTKSSDQKSYVVSSVSSDCRHSQIVIPKYYFGSSVTAIGERVFNGCEWLQSITIPDRVKSIGRAAFQGCSSLTDIQFLGTVQAWLKIEGSIDSGIGDYIVTCKDGTVAKDGTVTYF